MGNRTSFIFVSLGLILLIISCSSEQPPVDQNGPYLGQPPPGLQPEPFAPHLAERYDQMHSAPAISSDGREIYFSAYPKGSSLQKIYVTTRTDSGWTKPTAPSFSDKYAEGGPVFGNDGYRLYYYSRRPTDPAGNPSPSPAAWYVNRTGTGWTEPKLLIADPSARSNLVQTCLPDGSLFVAGVEEPGNIDIKLMIASDTGYSAPENIGSPINRRDSEETGCTISPDGKTMIISAHGRSSTDTPNLFWSQLGRDGPFSDPVRMGDMINFGGARFPMFSPDGKYFFFTSFRNGREDLYWIDAQAIDYLKANDLNLIDQLNLVVNVFGIDSTMIVLDHFQNKHREYYAFDESLLAQVMRFQFDADAFDLMRALFRANQKRYPAYRALPVELMFAAMDSDQTAFDHLANELSESVGQEGELLEYELNEVGYKLLGKDHVAAGASILKLTAQLYPESSNAHDSNGDALIAQGDTVQAVLSYKKALELDPGNENAMENLARYDQRR